MSILRAEKILDYLATPLSRCLKDENPYVRKTAALCVAKVFDLKPELCIEYGFIETLRDLIGDGNPMVRVLYLLDLTIRWSQMPWRLWEIFMKLLSRRQKQQRLRKMAKNPLRRPPNPTLNYSSLIKRHYRNSW